MIRLTAHFSGRVQGVGFRYSTVDVARRFDVAGYVQNLPDGRVLLVAEGQPEELDAFLEALQRRMAGYIRETQTDRGAASGEFGAPTSPDTFVIRH